MFHCYLFKLIVYYNCFSLFVNYFVLSAAVADEWMHPHQIYGKQIRKRSIDAKDSQSIDENSANYWLENGQQSVKERINRRINQNIARNVILFLGDGMSIPTITAARAYLGGESRQLSFDKFPYTGLSKTYCIDAQVADSACSATAYLGGVKANYGTIGVTASVSRDNCPAMLNKTNFVHSIARWAQLKNKLTGLVTTSRVTHASPAGLYAHTAERNWESDTDVVKDNQDPIKCHDIAKQLVFHETGRDLNVILGGGRSKFLPKSLADGSRQDGINLIEEWLDHKKLAGKTAKYVSKRDDLLKTDPSIDHLLGLFNPEHINYNVERDLNQEPSLEEMTRAAIGVLSKSNNGYFLFVEGARIDMAHHETTTQKALNETIEFSKAVQTAVDLTSEDDTLIVVTADHAHTMSISGYAPRGSNILGIAGEASDKLPYSIINYANGPGYRPNDIDGNRHDISKDNMFNMQYRYPGISPLISETHGGEDVGIFARGPWAHLFTGVMEENVIPLLMGYASCLGDSTTACDTRKQP